MKKVFSVLTVAVLAVSTVFAGFSGSANVGLGYNFDNGDYGFLNQGNDVNGTFSFHAETGENKGEGSVYAGIKASMNVYVEEVVNESLEVTVGDVEAYVAGENFSVSILNNAGGVDYAKSAIDMFNKKPVTYALSYDKIKGVSGSVYDYKFGFGLVGNADKKSFTTALSFATPKYTLTEGLTLEAGVFGTFDVNTDKKNQAGWGLALAYGKDAFSASVASDMGIVLTENGDKVDAKFDADVAANVSYSPVSVDLYYATEANNSIKNLLSVKVAADLKDFAPVTVAFTGKDLVNTQDLGASVGVKLADLNLNATVNGGYNVGKKAWSTGLDVDYTLENVAKFEAGFGLKGEKELTDATVYAKATNTTLINNATLSLGYESANLLKADKDGAQYGAITASCTVKF